MKHPILILQACTAVLVASLFVAGCTFPSPGSASIPPQATAVVTPTQSSRGFTTCHGLDFACITNVPRICTEEYRLGDKCRQYAQCTYVSGGSYMLVTSPQFTACKSCVEQC